MMEKTLYECDADAFTPMSLAAMIDWLTSLAAEQPCPPDEVYFSVYQSGDRWDGYNLAEITIRREATPAEEAEAEAKWQAEQEAHEAAKEANERAMFERLKAKFDAKTT